MKTDGTFISFDGTKIAYKVYGDSTALVPIVFCSGIACDDVYWLEIAPELGKQRKVVTWDYPYHGDSGPPGDDTEIQIASLARHALAVMEENGFNEAILAGHSMGVQVILEVYRQRPSAVSALIPIAGPFGQTVGHLYGTNLGSYFLAVLEATSRLQPRIAASLWRLSVTPAIADPLGRVTGLIGKQAPAEVMRRYFEHLAHFDPVKLFQMFRAGHDHSAEDILETITVPVLIIHGTNDVMSPFTLAQQMAQRIPSAELVAVEGGAHTLPAEDPAMICSEILNFLRTKVDA